MIHLLKTYLCRLVPGLLPAAEALALLVLVAVQLDGFTNQLDLHPMDEAWFLSQGRAVARGDLGGVSSAWAPVCALAYALLLFVPLGDTLAPDAMLVLVVASSTLAAWWMLRAFVPPWLAVGGACWWALSPAALHNHQTLAGVSTYAFNATLCFAAIGGLQRWSCGGVGWLVAAGCLGLAGLNRGELSPWLLASGIGLAARAPRGTSRRFGVALSTVGACVLLLQFVAPDCRDRSWLAFRQGYAHVVEASRPVAEQSDPVFAEAELVARGFPGATSMASALMANPAEFLHHVARSAVGLPHALRLLIDGPLHAPWLGRGLQVGLVFALLWALSRARGRVVAGFGAACPAVAWLLATSPLLLGGSLLAAPRVGYLLPLWAPASLLVLIPLAGAAAQLRERGHPRHPAGALLAPAIPLLVASLVPGWFPAVPGTHREMREAVQALRGAHIPAGARLWARNAPGLLAIAGRQDLQGLDLFPFERPGTPPERLRDTLNGNPPDYVLFTAVGAQLLGAGGGLLQQELAREHWQIIAVSPGLLAFLYRRAP